MKVYIIIEQADLEIIGLHTRTDRAAAIGLYEAICDENRALPEWADADLTHELVGTLRLAGDDAYSVQLIERELTSGGLTVRSDS